MRNRKPIKVKIETKDGFELKGECFVSDSGSAKNPAAIVSPGMGVPARCYRRFAEYLSSNGIQVILFDYRGIGWSSVSDIRELEASATDWGKMDLSAAISFALEQTNTSELVGIGHSLGGSLFGLAENVSQLHQMVHICSQSGFYGLYDWNVRVNLLINIKVLIPLLTKILGYYPANWFSQSEALPNDYALEWAEWCGAKEYYMDEKFGIREKYFHKEYTGPLLSLSFEDDLYANKLAVDLMSGYYPSSRLERYHFKPSELSSEKLGHFDVFKPIHGRTCWQFILNWVNRNAVSIEHLLP